MSSVGAPRGISRTEDTGKDKVEAELPEPKSKKE